MRLKNILSITEARKNLFKLIDRAQKKGNYFVLTERGKPKAVIMSADEFDAWQETLEIQSQFSDLVQEVKKIDQEVESGEYKKWPTLEEVMAEHGYMLADKGKKKYGLANKTRKKSAKRAK